MRKFEWSRAHAVYIAQIDAEHQALFRLCDDFERAFRSAAPVSELQSILCEIARHTVDHFSHEERQMRATGYSLYAWHRRQHQAARSRMTEAARRLQQGNGDAAAELLEYLSGWLNNHVRLADRMLGAYLRNQQRAQALRAS